MLRNRIAVNIAFFLNGFVYANWVSRLPRIQELYNADDGTIGLVLFALALGAVGAMPVTGWLIIRNGSRRITLISLILYCAFVALIPFMPGVATVMMLYLIIGVSTGMLDVAMNAQAVMTEQLYQKPIMTSFHAFFSVGMTIGSWCGAFFADLSYDLPTHLSLIAMVSLVSVFWVSSNLIKDKPDPAIVHDGPLFRIPNKALMSIGIVAFCCMMGEGAMSDWTVNYMENIVTASKSIAPMALSAFAASMTLGRIFGDKARASWGDTKLIIAGGLMSITGLSLALLLPDPYVTICGFFIVGLGLSTIVPIAYSVAGSTKGISPGVGLAMVTTVGYTGFLVGPPIIGFIADIYDLRVGLILVLILFIIMTGLGFLRNRQPTSES